MKTADIASSPIQALAVAFMIERSHAGSLPYDHEQCVLKSAPLRISRLTARLADRSALRMLR